MKKYRKNWEPPKKEELYPHNEGITVPKMMVIGPEGPLGEMGRFDALAKAQEMELDLVLVAPNAPVPVAKIMDYNSYKYQKEKEARKNKASSKKVQLKVLRLSPRIGIHDLEVRLKKSLEFLDDGDKVRVEILLRGREKAHADIAFDVVKKFLEMVKEKRTIKIEAEPKREGSMIFALFAPLTTSN